MKINFWDANFEAFGEFFIVSINKKPLLTPLKNSILLPTRSLAEAIAAEWKAQNKKINKASMPLTQISCIAIDIVPKAREKSITELLQYADTDVVCYRAGELDALFARQAIALAPITKWAQARFSSELQITGGIMPISQSQQYHRSLEQVITGLDDWRLAALLASVPVLSSIVLGIALIEKQIAADEAFQLAHLEEFYETEYWGRDAEKDKKLQQSKQDLLAIERYLAHLN